MFQLIWDEIIEVSKVWYGLLVCVLFILGSDLLLRYFKAGKELRSQPAYLTFFYIAIGIFGTGFYTIFAIIDYLFTWTDFGFSMQALIPMVILTIFAFMTENLVIPPKKTRPRGKTHFGYLTIIGISFCIYAAVTLILHVVDGDNEWVWVPFLPVYIGIGIYGLLAMLALLTLFFHRLQARQEIRIRVFIMFVFGLVVVIGTVVRFLGGNIFYNELYFIGTIIEISGWIGIRQTILMIPTFSEFDNANGKDPSFPFTYEQFNKFFSNPTFSKQFEELRLRFSHRQGAGKPPRGEFSAIIILLLNNPETFGGKVRNKQILINAVAYIVTKVLNMESDSERIRKNTVNHLQKLKSMDILNGEGDTILLNSNWTKLL